MSAEQEAAPKHHASCKPNDRTLVFLCSQCGLREDAEALLRLLAAAPCGCGGAQCMNIIAALGDPGLSDLERV